MLICIWIVLKYPHSPMWARCKDQVVRWSQEWLLRIVESNIIRCFHKLWDSMHRPCTRRSLQRARFEAYFIYVGHILSLMISHLLYFGCDELFADDASISLSVIFENWLPFLQIQRHEPIRVLDCHLRGEIVPGSVFNQVCDPCGDVLHCFSISRGCGFRSSWSLPSLVHLIQSFKFI